jgi:GGDEF domain-containing protein
MGLAEAKKYIRELHRRQHDPFLWPDFLTGLPDKAAILKKLEEVFPKIGKYSVAYVRISNIQSYLIKYGPDKHADIIQWAAAILKTTSDRCSSSFVGTLSTHDFIVICDTGKLPLLLKTTSTLFGKRISSYYTKDDLRKKATLSFTKGDGRNLKVGLLRLVSVIADRKLPLKRSDLIPVMGRACDALESTDDEMMVMTKDMI